MTPSAGQKSRCAVILALAGSLLCSCNLLPHSEFTQPQFAIPAQWQGEAVPAAAIANREQWWKNFKDPVLDGLIDRALRSNNDLAAATIRVRRAQLKSGLTDTNLTPTVRVEGTSSVNLAPQQGGNVQNHSVSASLSYELDLWGKLSSLRDADRWEAEATEVDRQNTVLALIGTTASVYWQVALLNQKIAAAEASIANAEKTATLAEAKYRAGAVSSIELVQTQQAVASQKANVTQLTQQRSEARTALAILFDQPPENGVAERQQLPDGPLPTVEAGLPASLLGRRPDLRAAELRLRGSLANVDATRAGFYPSFTLTGSLGGSSASLVNVLQNPVAALGVGLVLPFVQWNTTKLTIQVAEADYEAAVVAFRQILYRALGDVENALSAHAQYQAESVQWEQAHVLARRAEQLAQIRYRAGATSVQSWLDEQERRRSVETALAENRLNRLKTVMKLYQAIGGEMRVAPTR